MSDKNTPAPLVGRPDPRSGEGWDRRTFLKASGLTVGGISLASLIAACGGNGGSGNGPTGSAALTLRMPFLADMQVPDPDIMYEGEGVQVMEAAYEGLIRYKPGTPDFLPGLAKSWTISPDQLTYTFTLQPNVKFHDGTLADADSWVKSFERRLKVNKGRPTWSPAWRRRPLRIPRPSS